MDCGICLSDDYDRPEFYHEEVVRARKQYKCCECNRAIEPKQQYQKAIGRQSGDFWQYKTCMDCVNIRSAFSCGGGFLFTQLWEDLSYYQGQLNTGCLEKIKTPTAKAYFLDRLRQWRGIEA